MLDRSKRRPAADVRGALAVAVGVAIVAALLLTPAWSIQWPFSAAAFVALMTACAVTSGVTATLLVLQARLAHSFAVASLALGLALTTATLFPYVGLYPHLFGSIARTVGSTSQASIALFLLWHLTFVGAAGAYQTLDAFPARDARSRRRRSLALVAGMVAWAAAVAAAIWWRGMPPLLAHGRFTPLSREVTLPLVGVAALLVAIGPPVRHRSHVVLDVCLRVTCAAMVMDVYLTDAGLGLFTVGWYASRLVELLALSATLVALLWQAARAFAELDRLASRFHDESLRDALTGIPNRRSFDLEFAHRWRDAGSDGGGLAVAIVDVDHFKAYNDRFGHVSGDRCLRAVATAIDRTIRGRTDFAARYGGEEFAILLSGATHAEALDVLERVRAAIARDTMAIGERVTASIGVATLLPGERLAEFVERADAALYRAKAAGRDRVAWEERGVA